MLRLMARSCRRLLMPKIPLKNASLKAEAKKKVVKANEQWLCHLTELEEVLYIRPFMIGVETM